MDAPATLVWIAPAPPDAARTRTLAQWARAHSVLLVDPEDDAQPSPPWFDSSPVADEVETALEHARDAVAARDASTVDGLLASADERLRAHPELPQAAWLMAELERCRASRWARLAPHDPGARTAAWARADVLDGGRAAGIMESAAATATSHATVTFGVAPVEGVRVWLDGRPATTTVETAAGMHAVVVTRRGVPVWARWLEVAPGPSSVVVDLSPPAACSRDDVAEVSVLDGAVRAPLVRCTRWMAAEPGERQDEIRVAACEAAHCAPLAPWRPPEPWTQTPTPTAEARRSGGWPSWASWTAAGAGAVVAGAVTLGLVEALRPSPPPTRFVYGGLKTE